MLLTKLYSHVFADRYFNPKYSVTWMQIKLCTLTRRLLFFPLVTENDGEGSLTGVQSGSLTQAGAVKADKHIKFRYLLSSDQTSPRKRKQNYSLSCPFSHLLLSYDFDRFSPPELFFLLRTWQGRRGLY